MYRRQNQSHQQLQTQQPKIFVKRGAENSIYDQQPVHDDIIELDQKAYGPYDMPDDGLDKGANDAYDHPHAVPGRSTRKPYDRLNAGNTTDDQQYDGPALPDRPAPNQYENVSQETKKPTTTPAYLELIHEDDEQKQTAVHAEPTATPAYLELIHVDEEKNQTAGC